MSGFLNGLGTAWDAAKETTGKAIDAGSEAIGAGLEYVGADGAADRVEDAGDSLASDLGARIGERNLGETDQPEELVHGNEAAVNEAVGHLKRFRVAFERVGHGMRKLDVSHWRGEAAEAFRERFETHPNKWLRAADACQDAAAALEAYADTITWAQGLAADAIEQYARGVKASEEAFSSYKAWVEDYNAKLATGENPGERPGAFVEPGKDVVEGAWAALKEARRQRDDAAMDAEARVKAAVEHAPHAPQGLDRLKTELLDLKTAGDVQAQHLTGGVIKGAAGLVNSVRAVNPLDRYNLTHPAEYMKGMSATLMGLTSMAAHPDKALSGMWESFKRDPTEFVGRAIPELFGTKGAGLAKGGLRAGLRGGREGLEDGADSAAGRAARDAVDDEPKHAGQCTKEKTCDGDPIDMATGRMLLTQTDIALPGTLPLLFSRTFESSFRSGGWFGPAWASTIDQRLLIDDQGVIFVREDRSLLAYPHPAPDLPTLPVEGQRWPLELTKDGYAITDAKSGQVWYFVNHASSVALLDRIEDRNGNWITVDYDPATRVPIAISHCGGYRLHFTSKGGRITGIYLAGAAEDGADLLLKSYGYDSSGQLIEVADSDGRAMRFSGDMLGRITSWTDSNGSSYTYTYDDQHRCIHQSGAEGHLSASLTYDAIHPETGHHVTQLTDSQGHTTRYLINDVSQIVAQISPLGAVTRFERDRYNRLLSGTDSLGHTTTYAYDKAGRLVAVRGPDGRSTHTEYNELDLPTKITGFDGRTIRHTYDACGNRTSLTSSIGATTTYAYTAQGHLIAVTNPDGSTSQVRCDSAGMPIEITDPQGNSTRYERDAFGRPVTLISALGATTHLRWTVEGKLKSRIYPDGHAESWTYDGEGNQTTHTDVLGQVTRLEYTHFDHVAARTGPDGVRHEFAYDSELRLTHVTNPLGETWRYHYDPDGLLVSEEDFNGRVMRYTYDTAGRLASRTNSLGQTVRFKRDAFGRITQKNVDGGITTYTYDETDQLATAIGPGVSLELQRNPHGRLMTETVNGRILSFGYDTLGRRVSRTTPTGAHSVWAYDQSGNRTHLTTAGRALSFAHDAVGRETNRTFDGGVTMDFTYDPLGRLATHTVTAPNTGTVQSRSYTYRADGYLSDIDDRLRGPSHFSLDSVGRVTSVSAHNWTETYAYDAAGNQISATWPDALTPEEQGRRTYTGTRVHHAGGLRYEYDEAGRTVLRQKTRLSRKPDTWHYSYNAEDQLTSVTTPDGTTWSYLYDPLGRRTAKQRLDGDGTVVEQVDFTWDGNVLCEESRSTTGVTITWDYDGRRPLTQYERKPLSDSEVDERFFAIVTDLIGTPTELLDTHGRIAARAHATLWGTTAWNRGATAHTPLRFPGQYHDAETGLHYNHHRIYDPATARYLTPDPLGLAPAPNPASYVHNPHVWSDPLGLAPGDCPPADYPKAGRDLAQAKADALRDAGIPEGAAPLEVDNYVPATTPEWQGNKQLMTRDHEPIYYTEEIYEHPNGEDLIVFQDHWFGHQEPGDPGYQPSHVHVRPMDDPRNGQVPGCEEHYYYDR